MSLNLPLDQKLTASVTRRRIAEEQRKHRIFNDKVRQIGVDIQALDWQIHNNILQRAKNEEEERKFAEEALNNDKLALLFEEQRNEEIREINKKIDEYRLSVQRPEYRRDFDLYDPDRKKKELPPRISDDDFCPVSGVQKLEGEDLRHKDRQEKQKLQNRDILFQQMQEKRLQKYKEDREIKDWENTLLNLDHKAMILNKEEQENRRRLTKDLKLDNKLMSLQALERKMSEKIAENIENRRDIEYNFYGPLLNEESSMTQSSLGSNRVAIDRWKGMSKEELEKVYKEQQRQMEENKRKKEENELENATWDQQLMNLEMEALHLNEEERRMEHMIKRNLQSTNHELSQEQKLRNDFMNKVAYRNTISNDFYKQFNTTTR